MSGRVKFRQENSSWSDLEPHWQWVVRNLIGANASFRRELFDDGGFTSGIGRSSSVRRPVGGEETEFCIRSAQARPGGFFVHDRDAEVIHRVAAERQTFAYFRNRCYSEGLSKALVTRSVGTDDGLASEWSYWTVTLPRGVLHGSAVRCAGTAVAAHCGAIVIGLAYTTAGYVVGAVSGACALPGCGMSRVLRVAMVAARALPSWAVSRPTSTRCPVDWPRPASTSRC